MARLGAIDQSINYDWLGLHDFNAGYKLEAGEAADWYNTADEAYAARMEAEIRFYGAALTEHVVT